MWDKRMVDRANAYGTRECDWRTMGAERASPAEATNGRMYTVQCAKIDYDTPYSGP